MKIFKLPDLGEGLPNAEIREWYVNVGDEVTVDQPMVAMETAKAVVEVPVPRSGKILRLHGKPGDIIDTGAPLVEFADGDEVVSSKDAATVAGSLETSDTVLVESALGVSKHAATPGNIKAMPAVRALAKQLNVDLATVTPTGPGGQITAQDVERAGHDHAAHSRAHSRADDVYSHTHERTHERTTSSASAAAPEGYQPLRSVRRAMALAMIQSHDEIVPVTLVDDADIYAWAPKSDITARVIRAIVAGCHAEPALNAWFDSKSLARRLIPEVNLALAIDSTEGLFIPVIKDVARKSVAELRETINRFKTQVGDRSIPQEELKHGTIILSNYGVFAGRYATPILVPPMAAMLGTGRIREEVVAHKGAPAVHRVMPLSLTFDHRACTGGEATRFLAAVIADLEKSE